MNVWSVGEWGCAQRSAQRRRGQPNAAVRGVPQDAEGEETPEGHVLRFEPGTKRIVGLTVINARWLLDRDGHLTVTIPETVQASADDLAPALAAA
jgi:hypothetical protein